MCLAAGLLLASSAQAKPQEILLSRPPTTAQPLYAWTQEDELVRQLVHASLYTSDGQGGWHSDLVTDYAVNGPTVTLTLAKARWHDKQPFGPADVCASIERVRATDRPTRFTAAARARIASCSPGIRKDADKVVITLTTIQAEPRAALQFPLVPAHDPAWAGSGPQSDLPPVGLGPYALDRGDGGWHLTAFDDRATAKKIDLVVVDDPARRLVDGRGVGAPFLAPADLAKVRADPSIQLDVVPRDLTWVLLVNPTRGPLGEVAVRTALDLLIDRSALGGAVLGRDEQLKAQPWTPVSGPFPPGSPQYNAGVPVPLRDERAAHALLEAHGLVDEGGRWQWAGHPWTLRVACPVGLGPDPQRLELALEEQLTGIDVEVVPQSAVQWWLSVLGGEHVEATDLALVPISSTDLGATFHSRTATRGWANPFGWSDPDVDGWLGALADRNTAQLLHARLAELHPALFLWSVEGRAAWRGGFEPPTR
ncbi:MAG: ABC transporter substrate-binding protein [Myxococcota bacterium]